MMDEKDAILLAHLRKNSRATLTDISRETDIPVSTIFERLKGPLGKYVKKYTCILENSQTGFTARATIILKVDKEQKADIGQFLIKHQNVNTLYRINNGYDFLADVIFRQMIELEEFIELLETRFKVKHRDVYFIIDEVKQEGFMADPNSVQLVFDQPKAKSTKKGKRDAK